MFLNKKKFKLNIIFIKIIKNYLYLIQKIKNLFNLIIVYN